MQIGRPRRIIEVEPLDVPVPEILPDPLEEPSVPQREPSPERPRTPTSPLEPASDPAPKEPVSP
jgi:hypothetical protein